MPRVITSYNKGIEAENIAAIKLQAEGYEIVGRRIKTKYGEIDILAKIDNIIVAVEVKLRRNLIMAHESISLKQKKRIFNALLAIMSDRNNSFETYRIDVVFITRSGSYQHIENAFCPDDTNNFWE